MLEKNFDLGKMYESILHNQRQRSCLSSLFNDQLPDVPLENILSYLNLDDMKNFETVLRLVHRSV